MSQEASGPGGPRTLEVTVSRSGGVAGMPRRWSAQIPDDGGPAARAARRIAGRGGSGAAARPAPGRGPGPVRDAFQWTVTSGSGSGAYDEADRQRDPDLDELIRRVIDSASP